MKIPVVKSVLDLSDSEIHDIYNIYSSIYVKKGIGYSFDVWKSFLNLPYYCDRKKYIQFYHHDSMCGDLSGYTIFTEPVFIDGFGDWSKIIEHGVVTSVGKSSLFFKSKLEELVLNNDSVNFFSEVGIIQDKVVACYEKSGFNKSDDLDFGSLVMRESLGHNNFNIDYGDSELVVSRKTNIKDNESFLFVSSN